MCSYDSLKLIHNYRSCLHPTCHGRQMHGEHSQFISAPNILEPTGTKPQAKECGHRHRLCELPSCKVSVCECRQNRSRPLLPRQRSHSLSTHRHHKAVNGGLHAIPSLGKNGFNLQVTKENVSTC